MNGAEKVYVFCYNGSGAPANSRFVASYLNTPLPNGHNLAYLRDDQPSTVSYDPTAAYNSSGGTNHIDRTGTGQYTVTLPGLGGLDGNVEIVALANLFMPGSNPGICRSNGWGTISADQVAYLSCRNPAGVLTDLPFSLTFGDRLGLRGNSTGKAAYFWADQPTSPSYLPDSAYRWSSSGLGPRVTRSGAGLYTVRLTGIKGHGGSAEVTAYSTGTTRCQVSSISTTGATQLVGVLCRAGGAAVDSSLPTSSSRVDGYWKFPAELHAPRRPRVRGYPWRVASLSRDDVAHVAHLARLGLTEQELRGWRGSSTTSSTSTPCSRSCRPTTSRRPRRRSRSRTSCARTSSRPACREVALAGAPERPGATSWCRRHRRRPEPRDEPDDGRDRT